MKYERWICLLALAVATARADDAIPEASMQLGNGDFVSGRLLAADAGDLVVWQGTHFTAPFRFRLLDVNSVLYPPPAVLPRPEGEFCFELAGGDVLYGALAGITDQHVVLDESKFGKISVRREYLRRFFRWNAGKELVFVGPAGLNGWNAGGDGHWRDDGGHLVTAEPEAKLFGDLRIPPQAAFEVELAWTKLPNFILAFGTKSGEDAAKAGARLEVVGDALVAVRESKQGADLAAVTPVGPNEGRVNLRLFLDQPAGRLLVYSPTGKLLADLSARDAEAKPGAGLTLLNVAGDVRLERLRISRWNGVPVAGEGQTGARLVVADTALSGQPTAFDPGQQLLTVRDGTAEKQIPLKDVQEVVLETAALANAVQNLHLTYLDGTRIGGTLGRIDAEKIVMTSPAIVEEFSAPHRSLNTLRVIEPETAARDANSRRETLELPGARLHGRLVDGVEADNASCLVWEPELSRAASPLKPDAAGRIVYRVPPKRPKKVVQNENINRRQATAKMFDLGKLLQSSAPKPPQPPSGAAMEDRFLHLRSGDTIPCHVTAIDERGVSFTTSLSGATFVPHEKVKAVELVKTKALPKLAKLKRERLLTLPRMHRDSPPTQLVCSQTGDILRGRILALTDTKLKLEVKLDIREIPRNLVAQIIWLHEDELADESPGDSADPPPPKAENLAGRVQVRRSDGIRLTFDPQRVEGGAILGTSDVLGECRTDLSQVDQLLFGAAIEQAAQVLTYHRWKLHHAVDPKFVQEENGEAVAGKDSPLVGKPAPDFALDFLDGARFRLSEQKGKVVVLDFWATWCGPCLQVMPQVEQVAGEFRDAGVQLVAVNLEESPKQITATLERHKLNVPVVLDQDGVVARKYAANAIPQTVIVDREGNVARLFIGGGPDYADQLREALKQVVEGPKPAEAETK